jgi:hypothetical protein
LGADEDVYLSRSAAVSFALAFYRIRRFHQFISKNQQVYRRDYPKVTKKECALSVPQFTDRESS